MSFKKFATVENIDITGYGRCSMNFESDNQISGTFMKASNLMKYNCPIYLVDNVTNFCGLNADNIEERGGKRVFFLADKMINYSAVKYIKWLSVSEVIAGNDSIRSNLMPRKYESIVADLLKAVSIWENTSLNRFRTKKKFEQ